MVERLDNFRRWQMRLEQFRGRGRLVVRFRDVAITLRVAVVGVDHDLPAERLRGHRPVVLQRNRHHDDVTGRRSVDHRRRSRVRTEFLDKRGQRLRPP